MKVVILAIFLFLMPSATEDYLIDSQPAGRGIDFYKGSFVDVLEEARMQQKPIFVHVFAKWCGPCKAMKRTTFKDKEAGEYFNANFINYALDGESDEGRRVAARLQVNSYPSLFIIDGNGKVLARTTGFLKSYILINFGRRVVP